MHTDVVVQDSVNVVEGGGVPLELEKEVNNRDHNYIVNDVESVYDESIHSESPSYVPNSASNVGDDDIVNQTPVHSVVQKDIRIILKF